MVSATGNPLEDMLLLQQLRKSKGRGNGEITEYEDMIQSVLEEYGSKKNFAKAYADMYALENDPGLMGPPSYPDASNMAGGRGGLIGSAQAAPAPQPTVPSGQGAIDPLRPTIQDAPGYVPPPPPTFPPGRPAPATNPFTPPTPMTGGMAGLGGMPPPPVPPQRPAGLGTTPPPPSEMGMAYQDDLRAARGPAQVGDNFQTPGFVERSFDWIQGQADDAGEWIGDQVQGLNDWLGTSANDASASTKWDWYKRMQTPRSQRFLKDWERNAPWLK